MANATATKPDVLCVYCGWDADSVDHILPRTWTGDAARPFIPTVPACRDCNARINDAFAPTLGERRRIAYESLERKYRKLLRNPSWSDDEMAELGPRLRHELECREALRRMVKYRLDNLARDDEDPVLDWLLHCAAYGDNFAARILDRKRAASLALSAA